MRNFQLAAFVVFLVFLVGCNTGGVTTTNTSSSTAPSVALLDISPARTSVTSGATTQLTASATWSDGQVYNVNAAATWATSASSIATVNAGLVTGAAVGTATITATYQGKTASTKLTVLSPGVTITSLSANPTSVTMSENNTATVAITATYSNGTTSDVTSLVSWGTSTTASGSAGTITGLVAGTTTLTASYSGKSVGISTTVTPGDPWASQSGISLKWSDEFNGTGIDLTKWAYETGGGGWGNGELETYTTTNATIGTVNGASCLVITAKGSGGNYTSARLTTQGLASWTDGWFEARIKVPHGGGMWPAFWMLGNNISSVSWPTCGETDIMEMGEVTGWGDSYVQSTIHWTSPSSGSQSDYTCGSDTLSSGKFGDAFHTFGVHWTSTSLTFYVDGVQTGLANLTSANNGNTWNLPFFFILNLAVGGSLGGTVNDANLPQTMDVNWVRVYQ